MFRLCPVFLLHALLHGPPHTCIFVYVGGYFCRIDPWKWNCWDEDDVDIYNFNCPQKRCANLHTNPYTMTAFISSYPPTLGYSPFLGWSGGWIKWVPSEFEFFWLRIHLNISVCFLGICVSCLNFLSFANFVVIFFLNWFVEKVSVDTSNFGNNIILKVTDWHFSWQIVCHIISSTWVDKS